MNAESKKLLTPAEVCVLLNMKMTWLRSAIFKKKIPFIKLGRVLRFDPDEISQWVESQKHS